MTSDDVAAVPPGAGRRASFQLDGRRLSYLDYGGSGPLLLALHGHLNEGRFVDQGAVPLDAGYRVVALDQRGHGESDRAADYRTDGYVDDALGLLDHLGVGSAVVLGHSLGAAVAYCLAARAPDRVRALVVVDIAAVIDDDLSITATFPRRAATRDELVAAFSFLGEKQRYLMREYPDGWGVPWHSADMVRSQLELNGDHWARWCATSVPCLLVHGTSSRQLSSEHAEQMAARRPNTTLVHLHAGHAVYVDDPTGYSAAVRDFLVSVR